MKRRIYGYPHMLHDNGRNFYIDGEMREVTNSSESQKATMNLPKIVKNRLEKGNLEPLEFRKEGKILIIL